MFVILLASLYVTPHVSFQGLITYRHKLTAKKKKFSTPTVFILYVLDSNRNLTRTGCIPTIYYHTSFLDPEQNDSGAAPIPQTCVSAI
jgi:hypothetical protein